MARSGRYDKACYRGLELPLAMPAKRCQNLLKRVKKNGFALACVAVFFVSCSQKQRYRMTLEERIKQLEERNAELEKSLADKDRRIADLDSAIASKDSHIANLDRMIVSKDNRIAYLEQQLYGSRSEKRLPINPDAL